MNLFRITLGKYFAFFEGREQLSKATSQFLVSLRPEAKTGGTTRGYQWDQLQTLGPKVGDHWGRKGEGGTSPSGGHGGFVRLWHLWAYKQVKPWSLVHNYLISDLNFKYFSMKCCLFPFPLLKISYQQMALCHIYINWIFWVYCSLHWQGGGLETT